MKLTLNDVKKLPAVLQEFNWDLTLHYNEQLLDVCGTTQAEKDVIKRIENLTTRCRIERKEEKQVVSIDFLLPTKDGEFLAKGINQFITSALVNMIQLDVYNSKNFIEYTYFCTVKQGLPDWHDYR